MKNGFNCTQSVLGAYADAYGVPTELARSIAAPFGSGMGFGEVCGAVTGAFMVIGLKYPRVKPHDTEMRDKNIQLTKEFSARFLAKNGSIHCNDLLGVDVSTQEGVLQAREQGLFPKICPLMVRDAVEILEDLLADAPQK
jgi:C_GCAxxG_C_C family probable redox protein